MRFLVPLALAQVGLPLGFLVPLALGLAAAATSPTQVASGKANCSKTARYALALRGGVSKMGTDSHGAGTAYFSPGRSVNITIIANALRRHLFEPNGGRSSFDVFIHSWS